ncbi:MAG: PilW family protein [Deltaproteobacteria bacterium]|nr:PilW family protein [Deltaproteobacteria bacterium]
MKNLFKEMKARLCGQAGIGIVELLVALTIGLILMGGIFQVFVGSTTTYSFTEDLSRLQENGRFALHILKREVREAGFLGCLQDVGSFKNTLNNPDNFAYDFSEAIYGLDANGGNWADDAGAVDPALAGTANMGLPADRLPLAGSDILVLRGVRADIAAIEVGMPPTSADLKMTAGLAAAGILKEGGGDILLITDCEGAAVFQTTQYVDNNGNANHNTGVGVPGNSTKALSDKPGHSFGEGSTVYFPQTVTFYLSNNDAGQPSLYRQINQGAPVELVDGVENMQVVYGEDTDGDRLADRYVAATAVTDWGNVVSARVGLLMRTVDEILRGPVDNNRYDVDGDAVLEYNAPGNDRRLRMVVRGTMGLRNRLR